MPAEPGRPDATGGPGRPDAGRAPVVVAFDLDGVLLRTDSFTRLVLDRLTRAPGRLLLALLLSPVIVVLLGFRSQRARGFALAVWLAVDGLDEPAYVQLARRVGARLAAPGGPVCTDGVATVQRWIGAGARVVVVTASEQHLARAFLDAAGLGEVPLLASTLGSGPRFGCEPRHNRSEHKVAALAGLGLDALDVAYSDSLSDLPMLALARRPVLVNPSARARRRAARRLGVEPEAVRWS